MSCCTSIGTFYALRERVVALRSGVVHWAFDAFVIAANNRKEANTRPTAHT